MKIIVDTCIWSLALRRGNNDAEPAVIALKELIHDARVQMMGPIRQEILSGIRTKSQFDRISGIMRAFPDSPLSAKIMSWLLTSSIFAGEKAFRDRIPIF